MLSVPGFSRPCSALFQRNHLIDEQLQPRTCEHPLRPSRLPNSPGNPENFGVLSLHATGAALWP